VLAIDAPDAKNKTAGGQQLSAATVTLECDPRLRRKKINVRDRARQIVADLAQCQRPAMGLAKPPASASPQQDGPTSSRPGRGRRVAGIERRHARRKKIGRSAAARPVVVIHGSKGGEAVKQD